MCEYLHYGYEYAVSQIASEELRHQQENARLEAQRLTWLQMGRANGCEWALKIV